MKKTLFVTVLLASGLAGCGFSHTHASPIYKSNIPTFQGLTPVIVYRPAKAVGAAVRLKAYVDDEQFCTFMSNTYGVFYAKPGAVTIVAGLDIYDTQIFLKPDHDKTGWGGELSRINVNVPATGRVYVRIASNGMAGKPDVEIVKESVAKEELEEAHLAQGGRPRAPGLQLASQTAGAAAPPAAAPVPSSAPPSAPPSTPPSAPLPPTSPPR